jgi:hypothetical protein
LGIRTSSLLVLSVLGDDYGPRADGSLPDLTPYIATASNVVDQVAVDSSANGFNLSGATLELIERWLSAHYYTKNDPTYTSRAGASFVRGSQDPEPYVGPALDLDPSGCLNALLKRQRASGQWLGKPANQWQSFEQRNGCPPWGGP